MKNHLLHPKLLTLSAFSMATAHAAEPTFEIYNYTGKELFPSAIISTATVNWSAFNDEVDEGNPADKDDAFAGAKFPILGDPNGWIGVALSDVPEGARIKVEMTGDGCMKPSSFVGEAVDQKGNPIHGDLVVLPKEIWDYDALRKIQKQKPLSLTVKVTIDDKELPQQIETLVMRSMNDCPLFVKNEDDPEDIRDFSWCFAAYVNENHPWIDGLLKEALATAKNANGETLMRRRGRPCPRRSGNHPARSGRPQARRRPQTPPTKSGRQEGRYQKALRHGGQGSGILDANIPQLRGHRQCQLGKVCRGLQRLQRPEHPHHLHRGMAEARDHAAGLGEGEKITVTGKPGWSPEYLIPIPRGTHRSCKKPPRALAKNS